jgi:uncharacterized membrane protein YbhN (UPF0104 family)
VKFPLKKIILLSLSSLLIFFVLFKTTVHWKDLGHIFHSLNPVYFWIAFLTIPVSLFLCGVRWYFVLQASGFDVSFKKVLGIVLSSTSLSIVPGRLGDLTRSYPLKNEVPIHKSIGTIILEKIIDVCVLCGYASIGLFFVGSHWGLLFLAVALFSIPLLIILRVFSKNLFASSNSLLTKLHEASDILLETRSHKKNLFAAMGASATNWSLSILQTYWLFLAVGSHVPIISVMAYLPLSIFVGLIPITLAGIGTRDAAFIRFFMAFANPEQSLYVGILYSLQSYVVPSLLALPFLYHFFKEDQAN